MKSLKPSLHQIVKNKSVNAWTHVDNWLSSLYKLTAHGEAMQEAKEISAAGGIPIETDYKDAYLRIRGNSGAITKSPQIAPGADGQAFTVEGRDAAVGAGTILQDGNGLKLAGGASFTLKKNDVISFRYNAEDSLWVEHTRSQNS
jgi:hypothetical protein